MAVVDNRESHKRAPYLYIKFQPVHPLTIKSDDMTLVIWLRIIHTIFKKLLSKAKSPDCNFNYSLLWKTAMGSLSITYIGLKRCNVKWVFLYSLATTPQRKDHGKTRQMSRSCTYTIALMAPINFNQTGCKNMKSSII